MKQSALPPEEEILEKYYSYREIKIQKGEVSPFTGMERATLGSFMRWLCKRYTIVSKQSQGMGRR